MVVSRLEMEMERVSLDSDSARDANGCMTEEEREVMDRLRDEAEGHASARHRARLGAVVVPYRGLVLLPLSFWKFDWCGFEGRLEDIRLLDLRGNGLRLLSRKVGKLSGLRALLLGENELESVPDEIGKLKQLRWLDLSQNRLRKLAQDFFAQLVMLEDLNLSGNMLMSHNFPSSIGSCKHLQKMNLSSNDLTNIPGSFAKLTELTELDLTDNQVSYVPRSMYNLRKLNKLYILGGSDVAQLPMKTCDSDSEEYTDNLGIRTSSFVKLPRNLNLLVKGYSFHEKTAGALHPVISEA